MVRVRIYKPGKSPLQSGRSLTKGWVMVFSPLDKPFLDSLMGWHGSTDMNQEVRLRFDTLDAATSFAHRHGLEVDLSTPLPSVEPAPKSYADVFKSRGA